MRVRRAAALLALLRCSFSKRLQASLGLFPNSGVNQAVAVAWVSAWKSGSVGKGACAPAIAAHNAVKTASKATEVFSGTACGGDFSLGGVSASSAYVWRWRLASQTVL